MSHIPEDKQRQYEKIFIEMDAIKRIIRKEYKYISYATDVEGLRIDIEAIGYRIFLISFFFLSEIYIGRQ